jgi:hypothetical protein
MEEQKTPTPPEPAHQPGTPKGEERTKEEGKEPGRHDTGTTGTKRPTGKSTAKTSTSVNPKEPIDPQSPNLPPP